MVFFVGVLQCHKNISKIIFCFHKRVTWSNAGTAGFFSC